MEVKVVIPAMDLNFKSFSEDYFSAPTSPTRFSQFNPEFHDFCVFSVSPQSPPSMNCEEDEEEEEEEDFEFRISEEPEKTSVTADELFAGGQIRTLKLPPVLQERNREDKSEIRKSSSRKLKKLMWGDFSPGRKKEIDPFEASMEKSRGRTGQQRGRERSPVSLSSSNSVRRAARSLSPLRVSNYLWEDETHRLPPPTNPTESNSGAPNPAISPTSSAKKWRFKHFFLFRSASEGRASDKDPLKKYTAIFRRKEEIKSSSFRSTEGSNSSSRRKGGPVSAHAMHYTANRAVSLDLKKKTFLPYKQGILGRLAFNPAVHAVANGFGLSHK